mgnify:CR=1 FL=1
MRPCNLLLSLMLAALCAAPAAHGAVLRVSWDKSPEASVESYRLFWGNSPGSYGEPVDIVPALGQAVLEEDNRYSARLSGFNAATTYYFALSAVSSGGLVSQPSAEVAATTLNDSDGDGISDDWETAHGLDPHDSADAAADWDGDGVTNLEHYLAGSDPGPASYTLATSVNPAGGGTVSPFSGTYSAGAQVTLTATPASGYQFDHWGGDASGTANPLSLTLERSKSVVAYFAAVAPPPPPPQTHFPRPAPQPSWVDFQGSLRVCGVVAEAGDEIAAFDPQGVLCGQFTVSAAGYYGWLHVYGDDPATPQDEGASPGDLLTFRFWDESAGKERVAHPVALPGQAAPTWTQNGEHFALDLECHCSQSVPLRAGWNLVSFSTDTCYHTGATAPAAAMLPGVRHQRVATIGEALASIAGKYEAVRSFDAAGAHTYDPSLPDYINDLTYLAPGYGYWIKATQACTLTLPGNCVSAPATLPLAAGWNLVGCWADRVRHVGQPPQVEFARTDAPPPLEEVDAPAELLPGLAVGSYEVVRGFDALGAHTYDPRLPDYINDLTYVGPGYGYWIKMKSEATLGY